MLFDQKKIELRNKQHIVVNKRNNATYFKNLVCSRKFCRMQSIHGQSIYVYILLYVTWTTCFDLSIF